MKIGFVSLGCSKNLVDTEKTIGIFKANDYEIVNTPEEAEVIVINTCGFIESAKEEAINTILEMAEYKKQKCKYLIVMGCLVERYKEELEKALPEVDLYIKYSEYNMLWTKIQALLKDSKTEKDIEDKNNNINEKTIENQYDNFDAIEERVVSTGANFAYLKIADGCSNRCTYCAIPYIRGPQISRKMEDILKEAKKLASSGYKELIVIAQDTTKYGIDIYGEPKLAELLDKISKIDGIKWIRFLYAYPETITPDLIKLVKENDKICKYFDIPIQHISNEILKKMNRKTSKEKIENLIEEIRKQIPDVTLRTSLIVGFPGETKENFEELYEFVKKTKFDKLGVFKYSKEENTPAAVMPNQIHYKTKEARERKIMNLQKNISKEKLEKNIGKNITVLVENKSFDGKYLIGRTSRDVPEEDGIVYIKRTEKNENAINQFIKCKIVEVSNYDLIAESI